MLHPDGEGGLRLRSGIHGAQCLAHLLIDAGDLLSARLAGPLNRLQRLVAIVVIIEIFIEELIIAKPYQLRGEVLHRRLLVQFRAGDQPFGHLFPTDGEVGKPGEMVQPIAFHAEVALLTAKDRRQFTNQLGGGIADPIDPALKAGLNNRFRHQT